MDNEFARNYLRSTLDRLRHNAVELPIDEIISQFETTFDSYFLTGKAGTGKSWLIKKFLAETKKKVIVLAPTGVAALNINGQTIHSFFKFPIGVLKEESIFPDETNYELLEAADTIIIDEVSMVRADLMDAIDVMLRKSLKVDTQDLEDVPPFAGKQIICVGDLYQLPPVVGEGLEPYFKGEAYPTPFFFSAHVFDYHPGLLKVINLEKVHRQPDALFKYILNLIRNKKLNQSELDFINKQIRIIDNNNLMRPSVYLASTNETAARKNEEYLQAIDGEEKSYTAEISEHLSKKEYPTAEPLRLKVGAQIMMLTNNGDSWVNGSLGEIIEMADDKLVVSINGITHTVEKHTWEIVQNIYDVKTKKIKVIPAGTFTQYPVNLSWAMTIHKSQGKTFDSISMDFGKGAFAHGQLYVAFSRCKYLNKVQLAKPIKLSDIKIDPNVDVFMSRD